MSYLSDYLFYASENECDPKFHRWAGLMVLSAAASRKIWVQYGDWKISPNMYVFFVGPPAAGKSVAMELAEKVVHDFTDITIAPNAITAASLVQTMGDKKSRREYTHDGQVFEFSPVTIFSDELVSLLGPEPTQMIDLLTALYSNGSVYRNHTKNQGKDEIPRPCITMICCLTPQVLSAMLTEKMISGGLTRRMTLVYCAQRGPAKPWPQMTPPHFEAKNRCVEYARNVQKLSGPIALTASARAFYERWYLEIKDAQMRDPEADMVMQQYFSAKNIHLLKLSTLVALSDRTDMVIDQGHVEQALTMLDELEPDIMRILGSGGRNDLAPLTRDIAEYVKVCDVVPLKRILLKFQSAGRRAEIDEVLKTLCDSNILCQTIGEKGIVYAPVTRS